MSLSSCHNAHKRDANSPTLALEDSDYGTQYSSADPADEIASIYYDDSYYYINSVRGHDERDTIVGNFTGKGIDTIYVFQVDNHPKADDFGQYISYYAKSNNPQLPSIKLFGYDDEAPKLVYEGDVDSNGKDEWGYLHTWNCSQWRTYRVYTLVGNEWRFLIDSTNELLDTQLKFRATGVDIVEKGNRKGYVKINYMNDSLTDTIVHDTIVAATYTKITKVNK
jgi:hypothetical protein